METWRLRPRKANVEFRAAPVRSLADYRIQQGLQVVALENIRVDKELSVDYGRKYSFE